MSVLHPRKQIFPELFTMSILRAAQDFIQTLQSINLGNFRGM